MRGRARDPKAEELVASRTLNPHPEAVQDEAFASGEFFDARDLVQVKYEMVRRVEADGVSVTDGGVVRSGSRGSPTTPRRRRWPRAGLAALVPAKPGPARRAQAHRRGPRPPRGAAGRQPGLRTSDLVRGGRRPVRGAGASPVGGTGAGPPGGHPEPQKWLSHAPPTPGAARPGGAASTVTNGCASGCWPGAPTAGGSAAGCWPARAWPRGSPRAPRSPRHLAPTSAAGRPAIVAARPARAGAARPGADQLVAVLAQMALAHT